ncbi:Diamine acetyltransferase 1 [Phytophthora pseudosyringae]|uniref:Diamine acetyltransferase 1 n=1 Tax=Phytophthora pseudosyringae TaxID=221518 RepID=A0A8T1V5H0_9STRA|nr:Diamine acetyltransferase 1 [Phytophthora pseudosyringae]
MATHPFQIRRALRADVHEISAMIQELADFEKESDANQATPEKLLETVNFADDVPPEHIPGFPLAGAPSRKVAHCFVLTVGDTVAGMALFFYNYSTWLASPGVYLEDLYVRPEFHRQGLATLLFGALAEETQRISDGQGRLEWSCLRWNEGALAFYDRIGGERMDEWVSVRVAGGDKLEYLKKLADDVRATSSK